MTIEQDIITLVQPQLDALSARIALLEAKSAFTPPIKGVVIGAAVYPTFTAAAAKAKAGDTIQIYGQLMNDSAGVSVDCTIQGMTPDAGFNCTPGYAFAFNGQGYIIANSANIAVKGLEFQNMVGTEGNVCGVRGSTALQTLLVDKCSFHDGQEGMLVTSNTTAKITITNSQFYKLGAGDGQTHSIYANGASLLVDHCIFQAQNNGSMVKSRCLATTITNSYLADWWLMADNLGQKTYNIDLSNGGVAVISNNIIEQGTYPDNHAMFTFGSEGLTNPNSKYSFFKNICVNDFDLVNKWVVDPKGLVTAAMFDIHDNVFAGPGFDLTFGPVTGIGSLNSNKVFATRALAGYPAQPGLPAPLV